MEIKMKCGQCDTISPLNGLYFKCPKCQCFCDISRKKFDRLKKLAEKQKND